MLSWTRNLWWFILPAIFLSVAFAVFPMGKLFDLSIQSLSTFESSTDELTLDNYQTVISSSEFPTAIAVTLQYTIATVILQLLFGMVTAFALSTMKHGVGFTLAVLTLPYALPTVIVAFLWRWILNDSLGIVNVLLSNMGLVDRHFGWFSDSTVFFTVVFVSVWQFAPFVTLLIYAKLRSIPSAHYRAAEADGLSSLGQFRFVTFPSLIPVITMVLILRALWMASKFDTIWLLVGRDAIGEKVLTVPILVYRLVFDSAQLGTGSAAAMLLTFFLMCGALLYFAFERSSEENVR